MSIAKPDAGTTTGTTTGTRRVPRSYRGAADRAPRGVAAGQRVAAPEDQDVVVFLIGMRINRWRRVRSWWPVFVAMPRMLAELGKDPGSGFLGARSYFSGRSLLTVQYWRSVELLGAYARDPQRLHQPAWAAFHRAAAGTADVGLYHETYVVPAANVESLYANMPVFGLGAALGTAERSRVAGTTTAARRMGQQHPEYVEDVPATG